MRALLIALINVYRWFLSPLLGQNCRFYPTCSCYAQDAIRHHGVLRGHVAGGAPDRPLPSLAPRRLRPRARPDVLNRTPPATNMNKRPSHG